MAVSHAFIKLQEFLFCMSSFTVVIIIVCIDNCNVPAYFSKDHTTLLGDH